MLPKSIQTGITIFNAYETPGGGLMAQPAVLTGVFWRGGHETSVTDKGANTAYSVSVMVLMDAQPEGYVPPNEFAKLSDERRPAHWTIASGDKLLKSAAPCGVTRVRDIETRYGFDNVFTVMGVTVNDYGPPHMRHYVVLGK